MPWEGRSAVAGEEGAEDNVRAKGPSALLRPRCPTSPETSSPPTLGADQACCVPRTFALHAALLPFDSSPSK
eukprot:CAMPEP_0206492076 /NCGR_PEP_ID=MMETSP0324_2-20121206/45672_1 /ASSEMBLY_ACC=CAM_ASM_000836 /TAXON_ID=2866 /ORGANISM="Crypthecodinium cohnii, Strain Seligo" /LENGTH=71 /DNA_ID=CAMNT_0053973981 /DNA_START=30 /DNA_END=245 /DNA_ORIENTATION=+